MTLRVGVIGTGMIGQDHIRRLTQVLSGAEVVAVSDANEVVAKEVAAGLPERHGARHRARTSSPTTRVDAVIVCSWGPTHEEYVLAAIAAGKPVFCEKPLATTTEACRNIIDAEVAHGSRLVQVGFMRRYDAAYRALKGVIDSGQIGAPLIYYSGHRNASVPEHYTKDMAIVDTAVHDFDVTRWLLGEELAAIRVIAAKPNSLGGELQDPLLMILETRVRRAGQRRDLGQHPLRLRHPRRGRRRDRHRRARRTAGRSSCAAPTSVGGRGARGLARALHRAPTTSSSRSGSTRWPRARARDGPSAWDGYAAQAVCDAGVEALHSGERVEIDARRQARPLQLTVPLRGRHGKVRHEGRPRPVHVPHDPAARAAGRRGRPGLRVHRAVAARGPHAVLPAPAHRRRGGEGLQEGAGRGRGEGRGPPAALPLVRPGRGRAAGRGPLLEAGHPDHRRPRLPRDELRVQRPAGAGQPDRGASSGSRWRSCSRSSSGRACELRLEPHPDDFVEDGLVAVDMVRGINCPLVSFLYCAPHTFHMGGNMVGDHGVRRAADDPAAPGRRLRPHRVLGPALHREPAGLHRPGAPAPRHRPGRGRLGPVLRDPEAARLRRQRPQHHDGVRLRVGGPCPRVQPLHA